VEHIEELFEPYLVVHQILNFVRRKQSFHLFNEHDSKAV